MALDLMLPFSYAGYDRPRDLAADTMLPLTKRLDALKAWRGALMRERAQSGASDALKTLDLDLNDAIQEVTKELNYGTRS